MRTIGLPALDAEGTYEAVSGARSPTARRTRLLDARPSIFQAYAAYVDARADVAALEPATTFPATGDDLEGNYRYVSNSAKHLRASILQSNRGGRCAMCSQGRASTLDHYLPSSVFPEFSILPMNLIPACYDCNKQKAARYSENGTALFIHAYLDDVSTHERFLFATVYPSDGYIGVSFEVMPPSSMGATAQRIRSHFDELRLAHYYMLEGVNEVGERIGVLTQMLAAGGTEPEIRDYLLAEAESVAQDKGVNFWRYALLEAMANSQPICSGTF